MRQINPAEDFDLSYFIRNHTDATTYYVRAVIYDVRTGETLQTENLEQSPTNARLFIKTLQAPADPSGYGRAIVAIATVYTDSAYTTKSENYAEQEQEFFVKASQPFLGGGGGVDMRELRELIDQRLAAALKKLPKSPRFPKMPWEQIFGALGALQREVSRVPKKLPEAFDASPLLSAVADVQRQVASLPPPEKLDLAPVLGAVEQLPARIQQAVNSATTDIRRVGAAIAQEIEQTLKGMADDIVSRADAGIKDKVGKQELTIPLSKLMQERKPDEPTPVDLSHLM